jgi:hypothetical protein
MTSILNLPARATQLVVAALATFACVVALGLADVSIPGVASISTPTASAIRTHSEGDVVMGPRTERAGDSYYDYRNTNVWSTGYGGYPQDWVAAGAHLPGGWTMYGSYVTGWIEFCHVYAPGNTLGAMIMNWAYLTAHISAYSTWPYC